MVPWALDADPAFDEKAGEQCLALLPKRWSPPTHKQVYSWRLDPRELGAAQAPEGDEQRKRMRRRLRMILTRIKNLSMFASVSCLGVGLLQMHLYSDDFQRVFSTLVASRCSQRVVFKRRAAHVNSA